MHLIKKENCENHSTLFMEQCKINLQQHFYYGLNQSFSEQKLFCSIILQPNKREGNCSFPNTTSTHSCNKRKAKQQKKMEMKNVISAIENEGKYIKINIEIIGIKKRIHIIQYNIALLYYVKEKNALFLVTMRLCWYVQQRKKLN